jgi:transcriptional regulator with XRE-family HTH domain
VKITKQSTDASVLAELGARLAALRLDRNMTQAQLAEEAGVSKRSVERLESGDTSPQLSGFIRVCRVLGIAERFDVLVPESAPSPVQLLKLAGNKRRRASKPQPSEHPAKKWKWGDES